MAAGGGRWADGAVAVGASALVVRTAEGVRAEATVVVQIAAASQQFPAAIPAAFPLETLVFAARQRTREPAVRKEPALAELRNLKHVFGLFGIHQRAAADSAFPAGLDRADQYHLQDLLRRCIHKAFAQLWARACTALCCGGPTRSTLQAERLQLGCRC